MIRPMHTMGLVSALLALWFATACGSGNGGAGGDPPEGCDPAAAQCNNCDDDDGDGLIDGFDPECTGPLDNLEGSFATGIPGDNIDAIKQDCFFDGNSGQGDDGCNVHVCCLLDDCPPDLQSGFDPAECAPGLTCIESCSPLTPPGCDCFGCCTVCNGDDCFDILTNSAVSPECDQDVIDDPSLCPPCTKIDECGQGDCDPSGCILCPGQTEDDLPPECEMNVCPDGLAVCADNADCAINQFCATGCCVAVPE